MNKVFFIGAGPGDPELITVKGCKTLAKCETVIYAGSLVAPEILQYADKNAKIYDSSNMTLEEIINTIKSAWDKGHHIARLHTGDPSLYGAILEQMKELDEMNISYEVIPGVTALFAAAASLKCELTVPEVTQTVIITRYEGRTPVPEDFCKVARAGGTLCFYLSMGSMKEVTRRLIEEGRNKTVPAAIIYRASWPDEKILRGNLSNIAQLAAMNKITRHGILIVGEAVSRKLETPSKLYDKNFTHMFREENNG